MQKEALPSSPAPPTPRGDGHSSRSRPGIVAKLAIPLLAFLAARMLVMDVAAVRGLNPLNPEILAKWDSGLYLDIAENGYRLYWGPYPGHPEAPMGWRGNAGWMPLYPWVIRLFMHGGLSPFAGGALLSGIFALLTLVLIWNGFFQARWSWSNGVALLTAAFFPGMVYYHAIFPIAQLTFFTTLALLLAAKQRWAWAGLAGAAAAATYTTGVVVSAALFMGAILIVRPGGAWRDTPLPARFRNGILSSAITISGLAFVLLVDKLVMGVWTAFFMLTGAYNQDPLPQNPIHMLVRAFDPILQPSPLYSRAPAMQTLFMTILLVTLFAFALIGRKKPLSALEMLVMCYALAEFVGPLVIARYRFFYRVEASLVPVVILLPRLPATLRWSILAISIGFAYVLSGLYLNTLLQ